MALKKIKISNVSFSTGTSKYGRPYTMVFLEVEGKKASMYCDNHKNKSKIEASKAWRDGDEVLLKFEQKGDFLNFDLPDNGDMLELRVDKLEERIKKLEDAKKGE